MAAEHPSVRAITDTNGNRWILVAPVSARRRIRLKSDNQFIQRRHRVTRQQKKRVA